MLYKTTAERIQQARDHGREKILKELDACADITIPQLKNLFGERTVPIHQTIENFYPDNYRTRNVDPGCLDGLMLALFQAQEEMDIICERTAHLRNDEGRIGHKILQSFADCHRWNLCQAFFVHANKGIEPADSPVRIIQSLAAHVKRNNFPADLLQNLHMPLKINPAFAPKLETVA